MAKNNGNGKVGLEDRIVQAALDILEDEGYSALTVRNICKKADCSTTMFYYYFKDKSELLAFAVTSGVSVQDPSLMGRYVKLPPLEGIVQANLITARNLAEQDITLVINYFTADNAGINPSIVSGYERGGWLVREYQRHINKAATAGLFLPGVDTEELRNEINSIYYGTCFSWLVARGEFPLVPYMRKALIRHLNTFVIEKARLDIDDSSLDTF